MGENPVWQSFLCGKKKEREKRKRERERLIIGNLINLYPPGRLVGRM